jgi:hypothetical protein
VPQRIVAATLLCLLVSALLVSCGDDEGPVDSGCTDCQYWTELTQIQAQFPAVHPTRPEVIAFSSRLADTLSLSEDLWIREEGVGGEPEYFRITDDPGNERLPAWSPDGTRLSFSRFGGGRYDLWVVNVSDFDNPTDLIKLTSSGGGADEPARSYWRDNNTVVYTNGGDIIEISLPSGMTTELVPDPADKILGLGLFFEENQMHGTRDEMGNDLMVFVSEGRGPQGSIAVSAFAETGEEINAKIYIDQKPLLTPEFEQIRTPFLVEGIAPSEYVVTVNDSFGADDFCDTTLMRNVRVGPNQVVPAEFLFERPRGAIRVVGPPTDGSTRLYAARLVQDSVLVDFVPTGSVTDDTTFIDCLWPGTYAVLLERANVVIDAAMVDVCERRVSQACVSASQLGCLDGEGTIACIDTLVYEPPPRKSGAAAAMPRGPVLLAPSQQEEQIDLWVHDFAADSLSRLTNDPAVEQFPTWSPDGRYVAYLVDDDGEKSLLIMNYASRGIRSIPLPGRPTTRICNRTAIHPAWMPSGREIVVSLTNCDDEVETNEVTHLWVVDVSSFLPP